ncbi:TRAP transporter substrate-binding protein [Mesorhizobium sp.]|uniref:TRAP transporter substrate-binding protein n=1 Tax=Mesorhizobium sp. TaxID=1871066 RepID=UPI0025D8BFB2|nr:TRAP transporter substrate-binding protein [Mesorhizobium sp.]
MLNYLKKAGLFVSALVVALPIHAQAETVLRFATTLPDQTAIVTDFLAPWAKRVTEASGGELRIEVVNGSTIADSRNVYERVLSGVVDIAWGTHGAMPVAFPKTSVSVLPFEVPNATIGSKALWALYEQDLLKGEYDPIAPLGLVATPPAGLHARSAITSLKDMAGLKIRASDALTSKTITAIGASPIAMTPPELYQGLSQGVLDAVHTPYTGLVTFKLQEVAPHHLDVPLGALPGMIFINRAVYEGLPEKARAALDSEAGETLSVAFGEWFDKFAVASRAKAMDTPGNVGVELTEEETARWREATKSVTDGWVQETADGDAILKAFRAAMSE